MQLIGLFCGVMASVIGASGSTSVRFAHSYGSNMVLQRAPKKAVVWGFCSDLGQSCGSSVSVTLASADGASSSTTPASPGGLPGSWLAVLPATKGGVGTSYNITASSQSSSASIGNVLFGDVWVCSGQSNMAFLLENAFNGTALVQDANNWPNIRLFTSKKTSSKVPLGEQPVVEEQWSISSNASVSDDHKRTEDGQGVFDDDWLYMSAVCYIFGREVHKATGVPIGLVNTNWGGTPVEFWMSGDAETSCNDTTTAGGAYNGMIKPLLNMTITGAIWYQGEANGGDPYTVAGPQGLPLPRYACHFPAMIADWRKKWSEGTRGNTDATFPFGYVQLAAWKSDIHPAGIRWAQSGGYPAVPNKAMPNVFDAIAFDLLDLTSPFGSVHIRDKTTVGNRLAAGGLALAYGQHGRMRIRLRLQRDTYMHALITAGFNHQQETTILCVSVWSMVMIKIFTAQPVDASLQTCIGRDLWQPP
eukprot:m.1108937 g.1108937  ORF g.1108937 m.1108937 type:complete len:474 (+) comp24352_c0_seq33:177-1598(+)